MWTIDMRETFIHPTVLGPAMAYCLTEGGFREDRGLPVFFIWEVSFVRVPVHNFMAKSQSTEVSSRLNPLEDLVQRTQDTSLDPV